jgi:membrane-associated phospholipid phosphatase
MQTVVKLLADGLMIPIILIAFYALVWRVPRNDRFDRYTRIFMAGITSYFVAKIIGMIWQPEQLRPFEQLGVDPGAAYLNNPGFPSDHALFATFLTLAVWYGTRSRALSVLMGLLTVAVCVGAALLCLVAPWSLALSPLLGLASALAFLTFVACIGAVWYKTYAKTRLKTHLARRAKK